MLPYGRKLQSRGRQVPGAPQARGRSFSPSRPPRSPDRRSASAASSPRPWSARASEVRSPWLRRARLLDRGRPTPRSSPASPGWRVSARAPTASAPPRSGRSWLELRASASPSPRPGRGDRRAHSFRPSPMPWPAASPVQRPGGPRSAERPGATKPPEPQEQEAAAIRSESPPPFFRFSAAHSRHHGIDSSLRLPS